MERREAMVVGDIKNSRVRKLKCQQGSSVRRETENETYVI